LFVGPIYTLHPRNLEFAMDLPRGIMARNGRGFRLHHHCR
jgi:hypothetical protein